MLVSCLLRHSVESSSFFAPLATLTSSLNRLLKTFRLLVSFLLALSLLVFLFCDKELYRIPISNPLPLFKPLQIHAFRDPTEEYFRRRHNHDLLGPYHAGLEPYHDLELTELGEECAMPRSRLIESAWVPYTAIAIMFLVLAYSSVTSWTSSPAKVTLLTLPTGYSSVTSWTSSPAKVRLLLATVKLLPGPAVRPRLAFSWPTVKLLPGPAVRPRLGFS